MMLNEGPMRVLVIEDERKTADYLKKGLDESGFGVDVAYDGADGLHLALEGDHDVIVLDVMMPKKDGWAVLKELRAVKSTPVLFLTARDDVEDRVRGLELGGDDYLVKPFAFVELLARVRTLSRRGPPRDSELMRSSVAACRSRVLLRARPIFTPCVKMPWPLIVPYAPGGANVTVLLPGSSRQLEGTLT